MHGPPSGIRRRGGDPTSAPRARTPAPRAGRIQTASGRRRVGGWRGGRCARRSRGSRTTARPARDPLLEHGEDVVADHRRATRRRARVPRGAAADQDSETSSSSSQPMIERRPDHSRAPPPSSQKQRRCRGRDDRAEERPSGSARHRRAQEVRWTQRRSPCSDRIDSGWNCTPSSGRSTVAHAHHHPVLAPRGRDQRRRAARRRRASGSARPRSPAAARRRRPRRRGGSRRRRRAPGASRPTVPPYAVTRPCMPRQTPSTGRVAGAQHLACRPRSRPATAGGRAPATARRASAAARRRRSTSSCCTTRGSTPVTGATRCTRFHV